MSHVRDILTNEPLRLKEAGKAFGTDRSTLSRYINHGKKRGSDGAIVKLVAIRGPDGGWRTNRESWVRFYEDLNGGPAQ